MTHGTHLKELACLRFDALGGIDDHDRGVSRHQRAVGVLGEILVAGRVQEIDAAAAVFKLQDTAGDGDTSLFFDLHPVGHGVTGRRLALYAAGQIDGAAIEQKFLRQCRFTGIRV